MTSAKAILTALACIAATGATGAADGARQRVRGGDPFIHLENGTYYLYFSSGDKVGLTVYTSTDLKEWLPDQGRDKYGRAYVNGNGFGTNRFWAPEMHKYKGKYYLFHSAEEKVTVDVGDSPLGPFKNPEKKPFFPEGNIDNSFFLDDDGTPYMLYAHFYAGNEVWICELEKDLMHAKPETQRKLIRAEEDWEMNRTDPRFSKWSIAEGPCLIKKNGLYWLTYSSHHVVDDNYNVCLATATNVKGPYVKQGKTYTTTFSVGTNTLSAILAKKALNGTVGLENALSIKSSSAKIGMDGNGNTIYTADNGSAITLQAQSAGLRGQIAGFTISITTNKGAVNKSANAVLDAFSESIRAQNSSQDNSIVLQVGTKANQAIKVGLTDMRSNALGLKGSDGQTLNVSTQGKANAAINVLDNAVQKALDQQTTIGSVESRLEYTSSNLTTASENVQASESTIRDADMAKEMTNYTKNNVLLQAAQSMLAQANQSSSSVLSLLQ